MAKRYGLVIDLERCTGCQTCTVACKMENGLEVGSGIRVETVGGPSRDTPEGIYPNLHMYYFPILCMHCDEPPCVASCPTEAIFKRQDGIMLLDEEKCNGCQVCLEACPYDMLVYYPAKDKVWKCTLCAHRLDQGLQPFCVLCCEMEAMFYGDLGDPSSQISKLIDHNKAFTFKPERGTKPAIYYSPPKVQER
ncbi:4Fe-4S dicluster domain-containing protein [Chloroflexota bacterium]